MEKKSFIMHEEWLSMFAALPDADAGAIIKAMIKYTTTGSAGDVQPLHGGILAMLIEGYEKDTARYMETCERNRENVRKRWEQRNTTVYDRIQSNTNEYETIRNHTDKDKDKEKDLDKDKEKDKDIQKKGAKAPKKDSAREYVDAWNSYENRGSIPRINDITGRRLSALNARIKEHGRDMVLECIAILFASAFLRGENRNKWAASFDWFVKPDNFRKVMEGNYTDKQKETQEDIIREWMGGAV